MRRLVLEVTRTSIRALAAEGTAAAPRFQLATAALAAPPDAATIARLVRDLKLPNAEVISVLPREQVITRTLKLPSTDPGELRQMALLAAKAQLPYSTDEAVTDCYVVDRQEGTSTVHLVACQRDLIDRHLELLRQAGIEPQALTASSWGVAGWYQRVGKSPVVQEPVLVVNVDEDRTDLALIRQGRVWFSRSLSQGRRDWLEDDPAAEPLAQELGRSLAGIRKETPAVEAASVLLAGLGPLELWRQGLESRLGKPVIIREAVGTLGLPRRGAPSAIEAPSASPVVAIGVALAEADWLVNLLPTEVQSAQRQRRRGRELLLTGGLLVSVLLLGTGVLIGLVKRYTASSRQTVEVMTQLESVTRQTEQQAQDIALIESLLVSRRWTAETLSEFFQRTPGEILFENVTFERSRSELVVRGSAPTTREVLDYLRQLKESTQWSRVELRYSARRGAAVDARTDFEIVLQGRGSS